MTSVARCPYLVATDGATLVRASESEGKRWASRENEVGVRRMPAYRGCPARRVVVASVGWLFVSSQSGPAGVLFGPTANGRSYLSLNAHRGQNPKKSQWALDLRRAAEFGIFEAADAADHRDANGHFWGVRDSDGSPLGTHGERLAKFPRTQNEFDPWHGYPVTPMSGRDSELPTDTIIEQMIDQGFVSRTYGRKIQRRRA